MGWEKLTFPGRKCESDKKLKPPDFRKVESAQLHTMSDASTMGYRQCSYLKRVDEHGIVHGLFQIGMTRVAPRDS